MRAALVRPLASPPKVMGTLNYISRRGSRWMRAIGIVSVILLVILGGSWIRSARDTDGVTLCKYYGRRGRVADEKLSVSVYTTPGAVNVAGIHLMGRGGFVSVSEPAGLSFVTGKPAGSMGPPVPMKSLPGLGWRFLPQVVELRVSFAWLIAATCLATAVTRIARCVRGRLTVHVAHY